ncbi:hypothetical protein [Desulfobotulus mexicanus]|uniref:Recombinase domain-containing protein n=1 Tax=Desulfobotulus mexicanus TaxID=2586642 RepID=A0A5Q4VE80_9BACT|nr:hypothetical protein [Desulfobotulus mexicanus]TYT76009.1 hypothetical protein FIM25_00185 [Desulfobotulus mexicanus]
MNDFLQNLRNQSAAKERRFNKPNKGSHDNNPNAPSHTERRTGQDRRTPRVPQAQTPAIREETLLALQASLENLVETQRDRIFMEDRKAEAEERKAEALERLADSLDRLLDNLSSPPATQTATPEEKNDAQTRNNHVRDPEFLDTTEDDVRKTSRKYILKLIEKLRKDNMTYEQIAAYLTDNDYPTFSGRGRWHAQTIHRLCR